MCARTLRHSGTQPSTCPGPSRSMTAIIFSLIALLAGSCAPSYGSVRIGGDASFSVATVSRNGLMPRRGDDAPVLARLYRRLPLPSGLNVLCRPKSRGWLESVTDALCPDMTSSSSTRRRFSGLGSRRAVAIRAELARLRFSGRMCSRCVWAGGIGGSPAIQEVICDNFVGGSNRDSCGDVAM